MCTFSLLTLGIDAEYSNFEGVKVTDRSFEQLEIDDFIKNLDQHNIKLRESLKSVSLDSEQDKKSETKESIKNIIPENQPNTEKIKELEVDDLIKSIDKRMDDVKGVAQSASDKVASEHMENVNRIDNLSDSQSSSETYSHIYDLLSAQLNNVKNLNEPVDEKLEQSKKDKRTVAKCNPVLDRVSLSYKYPLVILILKASSLHT